MKIVSSLAIAATLLAGGAAAAPALALQAQPAAAPAQPARKFNLTKAAIKPISDLQKAVTAKDAAAYATALAASEAAAKNSDDRFVIAQLRLSHAIAMNDDAGKIAALQAIIASGGSAPQDVPKLYTGLGGLLANARNYDQAATAFEKVLELSPNDTAAMLNLAELRVQQKRVPDALSFMERAIAASRAAGQAVPETWYRRALQLAYQAKLPQASQLSRELLSAYPTAKNWRDSLLIFRQSNALEESSLVDYFRLMRATKSLEAEADYFDYAYALQGAGFPGEAAAVLTEGTAARVVNPAKKGFKELIAETTARAAKDRPALAGVEKQALAAPTGKAAMGTADAYLGYGDYAKAATLYRAAIQKGSIDTNLANMRLGMALAMAGQKAEAQAALKSVTGARAGLASYWLLWLASRS